MQTRLFHLHTLSALHCGAGQSADVVDLPIARARATRLPIAPGSSLRGVLRDSVERTGGDEGVRNAKALFGPRSIAGNDDSFAGALSIGDAHLLTLPVRCLAGIVSYATSPFILRRYARDLDRAGIIAPTLPPDPTEKKAQVTPDSVNLVAGKLVLEDLDLTANKDESLREWAEKIANTVHPEDTASQTDFVHRFALLPDDVMDFLAETATEVRARIRIDEKTGTVAKGALWYEEHLPAETLLWGIYALSASNRRGDARNADELAQALPENGALLQLGGNAGVGHGLVRFMTRHAREEA